MRKRTSVVATVGAVVLPLAAACSAAQPPAAPQPAPSAPSATVSQTVGTAALPSEVLDLKNWYLTLPTGKPGSPDTVEQPELARYTSAWFKVNDSRDGVVFTANAGGVTTKNSTYPRSELREMDGTEKASWSNTTGTHTMTLREAVTALPQAKPDVVTAQIHDTESDLVEVRLEGTRLIAQYDDGDTDVTLDPAYTLGTPYDLEIVATGGRVEISYNGVQKVVIPQSGSGWYFKAGSYVQSNPGKGEQPDATGTVVIYALSVTHSS